MRSAQFKTADDLLQAYYAARGNAWPAAEAMDWLRGYVFRRGQLNQRSFDVADNILDSSILDVEDVAEYFLGLNLQIRDLSEFDRAAGAPVFGLARPKAGAITVCTRAVEYLPLYRSTVMHEVAHIVLRHGSRTRPLNYSPMAKNRPPEEREADRMMAEALLPKPLLYLAVVSAGHLYGVQPGEAFVAANSARGRYQWKHYYFPFFVNRLQLSRQLVAVRMSQMRRFTEETYRYHLSYPMPNRWRKDAPLSFAPIIVFAVPQRRPEFARILHAWNRSVPPTLRDRCDLESFRQGTLWINVWSAAHLYELKQLFLAGLEREVLLAGKSSGLRKIVLQRRRRS